MALIKKEVPKPGQEPVWDYPRPPALRCCDKRVRIVLQGKVPILPAHYACSKPARIVWPQTKSEGPIDMPGWVNKRTVKTLAL